MRCTTALQAMVVLVLGIIAAPGAAQAYVSLRSSSSGAEVHWPQGALLTYRANVTNSSGLAASDVFTLFTTSLSRWKQLAQGGFSFLYYQGTDTSLYPNYLGSPYDNSIFFTSNAGSSDQLSCGLIALTEVWFDPNSGVATKADLRFNDNCYTFTTNPGDTISQKKIYLGDVATHELGHSLGLDHSQNAQASMVYTADLEMSRPSCDDQAALEHLYVPGGGGVSGALTGVIEGPTGGPLFGAHVQAIELERGVVLASALSDKDGSFSIDGLEPGHYGLVVEPYFPGSSTLSGYYSGISARVCAGGSDFNRTFALDGGQLASFAVTAAGSTDAGTIAVSCAAPVSANNGQESSFANAPVLATGELAEPIGTQSVISPGASHYYHLVGQSGTLTVAALAYTLFSPALVTVELLSANGVRIAGSTSQDAFQSQTSGYIDYDATATATLSEAQDVYVHVYSTGSIASNRFPSGSLGVSATPYYALAISNRAPEALYPLNARCEAQDNFGPYPDQGQAPPFQSSSSGSGSSGCGTIEGIDHDPGSPGGAVRLANFAGLIALLVAARRALARGRPALTRH